MLSQTSYPYATQGMFGETADQKGGFLYHAGSHSNVDGLSPHFQYRDCKPSFTGIHNRK